MTNTPQVMEPPETSCVSGDIQVSREPLFLTSPWTYFQPSPGTAAFLMETNPEDANLSLSEINTLNLWWKGIHHISSTSTISRPQSRSEDDYEVLSQNGSHQILRQVDLSTLTSVSSFSGPLPEPLQPMEDTDDTATVTTTSFVVTVVTLRTTSMTTTSTVTGTLATSTREPSPDMEISE